MILVWFFYDCKSDGSTPSDNLDGQYVGKNSCNIGLVPAPVTWRHVTGRTTQSSVSFEMRGSILISFRARNWGLSIVVKRGNFDFRDLIILTQPYSCRLPCHLPCICVSESFSFHMLVESAFL